MSYVSQLTLHNFRNHRQFQVQFAHPTTVVVGKNAAGKTSLVEAVMLASSGQSFRAGKVEEMIAFEQEVGRVKVELQILYTQQSSGTGASEEQTDSTELEVILTRGVVQGKKTQRQLYSVNGVRRRRKDFIGKLLTVSFRPEDMRLVEGSPSRRRTFLDTPLSLINPEYATALKTYDQALLRRNKLLFQVREGTVPRSTLSFWNQLLIKHGTFLQEQRRLFLATFHEVSFPLLFHIEYGPSVISAERIHQYESKEIAAGHTLIGPQKDDFFVHLSASVASSDANSTGSSSPPSPTATSAVDVAIFGSRGQQRMAVLWLKLCELHFLELRSGTRPMLLLDDILSELDAEAQSRVISLLTEGQSLVTTTHPEVLDLIQSQIGSVHLIKL